jgi:phytol kinase
MTFTKSSSPFIGAMGILIMGYGDGFAAIIGSKYGKHSFKIIDSTKSLEGSAAMFVFSFIVSLIIMLIHADQNFLVYSFIIALVAMFTELFSVFGLDNLTVPLITSYLYYLLSF